jgi:hypothetical protein
MTTYPDPGFWYQGASLTLGSLRLGPLVLTSAHSYGTNQQTDATLKIPDITVRPFSQSAHEDDPCTSQFSVFYTQYKSDPSRGVDYQMIFRLTSDLAGGVVGTEASLEVQSNYPELDMQIPRFTFTQPGFGILKTAYLPGDYQATLTVRCWNAKASIALDGWIMLECGYYKDAAGNHRPPPKAKVDAGQLVAVGRTSLYPVHSSDRQARICGAKRPPG